MGRLVNEQGKALPEQVLGRQLLEAGSAVGANYRAARRSRSKREFVARLGVVLEESDESVFWFELLATDPVRSSPESNALLQEARELRAIFSASLRTAKSRAQDAKLAP
jgi:four helix bundle protein